MSANKVKTKFVCSNCGAETLKWMGRCPQCGEWNTLEEQVEAPAPKSLSLGLKDDILTPRSPRSCLPSTTTGISGSCST